MGTFKRKWQRVITRSDLLVKGVTKACDYWAEKAARP